MSAQQAAGMGAATHPRCPFARRGVVWYRAATHRWQELRRADRLAGPGPRVRGRSCGFARYAADEWTARARAARTTFERWLGERTLDDVRSWKKAVELVQRIFPGSRDWVMSCSDAEGWNSSTDTTWFTYGWGRYYPGFEHRYVVGGPMQYKWPTFRGHYRRGLAIVLEQGYFVPAHLRDPGDVRAWLSMLGQAIAAGYAYHYIGRGPWFASWGNGC